MRTRKGNRPAGVRGKGKKRRNKERRRRVPHKQGRGGARARGTHREGGTATSHGTTAGTTTQGREGERGAKEQQTKRDSGAHKGTKAHTATRRTQTNTQTAQRHHATHAPPHPAARPTEWRHNHTHTSAPTASGRRALATRPTGGQPGEGARLTPVAPSQRLGAPPPPRGRPPASPTAGDAGSQDRMLCSWCSVSTPTPPAPQKHGQRGLAARPQGPAAGGGKAPHTRCPSQRGDVTARGTTSRHPRGARPLPGHARQRDSAGPSCRHTRAHSTWAAGLGCPPSKRAAGGGRAPDLRHPSQRHEAPPRGTPSRHFHSAQRRLSRAHAVGLLLGPHAHTTGARETRATAPGCPP